MWLPIDPSPDDAVGAEMVRVKDTNVCPAEKRSAACG